MDTNSLKSDSSSGDGIRRPQPPASAAHLETAAFEADAIARQTHSESPTAKPEGVPPKLGRYQVQKLLGRGGMGSVYLAHDEQLDRPVALKIPRAAADDETGNLMSRFFREARAVATLSHPNICPIYDVGCEGTTHFIAMGYIEGRPLAAYADASRRQPERQVALVVRKIALALHDAHEKGIVHRDLKPANIMIDQRGEPIVMDFGLAARLDDRWETRLTRDGTVIGTPAYMSPEQIDGRTEVGPASDIYSLGVVFYELLTGRCPYSGNVVSVIGQVLHTEPQSIAALRPDVSSALAEICMRAMAKEPEDRFESMKELARALTAFLKGDGSVDSLMALNPRAVSGEDAGGLEALLSASMSAAQTPAMPLLAVRSRRKQQRRLWLIGGLGALAAIVLIGLVVAMTRSGTRNEPAAVAANSAALAPASSPAVTTDAAEGPRRVHTSAAPQALPAVAKPTAVPASEPNPNTPSPTAEVLVPTTSEPPITVPPAAAPVPTPTVTAEYSQPETAPTPTPNRPLPPPENAPPPEAQPAGPVGHSFPGIFGIPQPGAPSEKVKIESLPGHFQQADRNRDGKLDPGEIPFYIIRRADLNRDDALTADELKKAFKKLGQNLFGQPRPAEQRNLPSGPGPGNAPKGPGPGGKPPRRP